MTTNDYRDEIAPLRPSINNQRVSVAKGNRNPTDMERFDKWLDKLLAPYEAEDRKKAAKPVQHRILDKFEMRSEAAATFANKVLKEFANGDLESYYRTRFAKSTIRDPRTTIATAFKMLVLDGLYEEEQLEDGLRELIETGGTLTIRRIEAVMDEQFIDKMNRR